MSKRYFFIFTLSTFLLTVIWIASNVYHSYATSTIDPILTTQIEEIPASFDAEVISDLKSRQIIEPDITQSSVVVPASDETGEIIESANPIPTEEPVPTLTPQGELESVLEEAGTIETGEQTQ